MRADLQKLVEAFDAASPGPTIVNTPIDVPLPPDLPLDELPTEALRQFIERHQAAIQPLLDRARERAETTELASILIIQPADRPPLELPELRSADRGYLWNRRPIVSGRSWLEKHGTKYGIDRPMRVTILVTGDPTPFRGGLQLLSTAGEALRDYVYELSEADVPLATLVRGAASPDTQWLIMTHALILHRLAGVDSPARSGFITSRAYARIAGWTVPLVLDGSGISELEVYDRAQSLLWLSCTPLQSEGRLEQEAKLREIGQEVPASGLPPFPRRRPLSYAVIHENANVRFNSRKVIEWIVQEGVHPTDLVLRPEWARRMGVTESAVRLWVKQGLVREWDGPLGKSLRSRDVDRLKAAGYPKRRRKNAH